MASDQSTDRSTARPEVTRRGVIRTAAVSGVALPLLAACGAETAGPGGDVSTDTGSGAAPDGSTEGGGGGLVPTSEVPVGGGVVLGKDGVVVTQPTEGEFVAFTAVCTHQGCTVGSVADGTIICPCHGSRFSAEDGSVVTGPASAPLDEVAVSVKGDQVVRAGT